MPGFGADMVDTVANGQDLSCMLGIYSLECSEKNKAILMNTEVWNQGFWEKIAITYGKYSYLPCIRHNTKCFWYFFSVSTIYFGILLSFLHMHTNMYLWKVWNTSVDSTSVLALNGFGRLLCLGLGISPPFITFLLGKSVPCSK